MIDLALRVLAAYLMGSVNGALLIGRFRGIDIRMQGSGNAGGTNALRTQGWIFASGVILIDVIKASLAVRWLPHALIPAQYPIEWLAVACAFAVVLGHVYPVFHGFRGGKGVAPVLGTLLALSTPLLLGLLAIWLVMMFVCGFVGLGSMVAAVSLPILVHLAAARGWLAPEDVIPLTVFGVVCAAFVIWTHRSNIARMRAGIEPRARKLWLLGRLRDRR
ncbi:MAG: glycerol-3-phosphate 1-O-acyltransferase PlsY [Gammaproteobacteria bacterium]|nr:glycerol-3-phosphate 1-O-acyltransferase PlsY [Gammaproteobacteria bacterium]MBM4233750.1 glycerol-3-phosphate 1-O-acyltransferase PlsY [Gammaproteobacteria bacterium]